MLVAMSDSAIFSMPLNAFMIRVLRKKDDFDEIHNEPRRRFEQTQFLTFD